MLLGLNFLCLIWLLSFNNILYNKNIADVFLSPLFTVCSLWPCMSYLYSLTIILVKFWAIVAIDVLI